MTITAKDLASFIKAGNSRSDLNTLFAEAKRIIRDEAVAAEQAEIQALVEPLRDFMVADTQYKISDLVLGVLGIKAPCHGITETPEQRKHRDNVAKPRIIGALEILGASKYGSGALTRYSFGEAAPEFETNGDEVESAES